MSYKLIKIEKTQGTWTLYLDRPENLNALNTELASELSNFFASADEHIKEGLKSLVLCSSNDKAFCAGADLKERSSFDKKAWVKHHKVLEAMAKNMRSYPVPIIAVVNGLAYGGGLELVLMSDIVFASNNASFALPEAKIGIIPGIGGTQLLPQIVGFNRAKYILLSSKPFSAEQAKDWGLVYQILTEDRLLSEAKTLAHEINTSPPHAIRSIKKSVNAALDRDFEKGLKVELQEYNSLLDYDDCYQATQSFANKSRLDS